MCVYVHIYKGVSVIQLCVCCVYVCVYVYVCTYRSDGLAAGVLGVGDRVADHVLEEHLEDTAGLLVDEARDALDTAAASQAPDGGLGDTLDVVAQDLAVPLGAALSEALAAFAASGHC